MIRILLDRAFDNERHYIHAVGLSADTKPTTGIITGSRFVAVDTGAGYLFDETSGEWNENQQFSEAVAAYIGIVVNGNKAALSAAIGQFVVLKNSSISGCPDGLYTAAKAIPANTAIDNTYLTAVSGGGLNVLRDNIATRTLAVQNSDAIAAGATKAFRIGTAYTGYTPIGIVSIFGSGTSGLVLQEFYLDETDAADAVIYYRNATSNSITPTLIRATILYKRN